MNGDAAPAHKAEQQKTNGNELAKHLVRQKHDILPYRQRIELAFAVEARLELIGKLLEPWRPLRGGEDIDEDFIADPG